MAVLNGEELYKDVEKLLPDNKVVMIIADQVNSFVNKSSNGKIRTLNYGDFIRAFINDAALLRHVRDVWQAKDGYRVFYNNLFPVEVKKKFDNMLLNTEENRKKAEEFCDFHNGKYGFNVPKSKKGSITFHAETHEKITNENYKIKSAFIRWQIKDYADAIFGFILQGLDGNGDGPLRPLTGGVTANNIKIKKIEGVNSCTITSEEKKGGVFTDKDAIEYGLYVIEFQFNKQLAYKYYQQTGKIVTEEEIDNAIRDLSVALNNKLTSSRLGLDIKSVIELTFPAERVFFPRITNDFDKLAKFIGQRVKYPTSISDLDFDFNALDVIAHNKNSHVDIAIDNCNMLKEQLKEEGKELPNGFKEKNILY